MPDLAERITLTVNGKSVAVQPGCTVAAAVMQAGHASFRRSVTGESRAALCGMGICFECRLTVDGQRHVRSCQLQCESGMDVQTDG